MAKDVWWFQPRAVREVLGDFKNGARGVCLVSPPGSGKTVMASEAVRQLKPKRAIAIVHTRGLKLDIGERLCETFTIQQLLHWQKIPGEPPDLVIWDECHHSAGDAWGTVFDILPRKSKVLGLTGTPQRSDGKALDRFESMVVGAHYSELLMARTIVPYRCLFPKEFREDAEPEPAYAWRKYGEDKKAIFYCRSVEQADDVARRIGRVAVPWHSQVAWKKREASLNAFKAGEIRCLVTVDALTEGIDIPDSECVVLASPCHNVSTYLQKTGRGGRSAPGKEEGLLLDLSGAHLRHGSPTEDREYSITGTGISRKSSAGGSGGNDWYYEREQKELGSFNAELVVGYDWRHPTSEDKRRQLGWLVEFAGRRGWGRDVAETTYRILFGDDDLPEGAAA